MNRLKTMGIEVPQKSKVAFSPSKTVYPEEKDWQGGKAEGQGGSGEHKQMRFSSL